jgi:hypothetical protein
MSNSMDDERDAIAAAAQNKKSAVAVAKKPGPAKKQKFYSFITVDKNAYNREVSRLANEKGAIVYAVTVSGDVRNSYDVHYYTVG